MLRTRVFALLSATLLGAALSGCTGTEEGLSTLRLALLTEGGAALRSVDTSPTEGTSALSAPIALAEPLGPGRDLHTVNSGRTLLVTRRGGVEARDADLEGEPRPFAALPPTFTPCLTQSALNAARTRLLTLSECPNDAGQFLALYAADGALIWTATLRTFTPPVGADTPPTRLAVVGDVGIVARAALGGGSEVIRAAPRGSGDPERDRVAVVSDPLRTVPIRDLANFGASVYAATDSGVRPLLATGEPNLTAELPAFGNARYDRLWDGVIGGRNLLFAWRDNALTLNGAEELRVWDGAATTLRTVDLLGDLRDLTLAPDGNLYALAGGSLRRYDVVLGLEGSNWQRTTLLSDPALADARALTWLVP
ncbi:hypothetical protein SAMN04488058_104188 [Deinococcus reticulitermitis]|uniref:PQQ-like domain-containing protein n=1 Tax=Deinococcus reticulitermitis TaxID=856736 RepID=A0A1H6WI63_9DEIO|nr:hypothetical protein [Deinococcus reticulitermitis]SEJ16638.1 hypothetical protein SAMN04488058_104188 [Deinococcus reticulitermitis]